MKNNEKEITTVNQPMEGGQMNNKCPDCDGHLTSTKDIGVFICLRCHKYWRRGE